MDPKLLSEIKAEDARANVFNRPWYQDELIEAAERMLWLEDFAEAVRKAHYTIIIGHDREEEWHWNDRNKEPQKW